MMAELMESSWDSTLAHILSQNKVLAKLVQALLLTPAHLSLTSQLTSF